MNIRMYKIAAVVFLAASVSLPATAHSVAFYPLYHLQDGDETAASTGQTIYLFSAAQKRSAEAFTRVISWTPAALTGPVGRP